MAANISSNCRPDSADEAFLNALGVYSRLQDPAGEESQKVIADFARTYAQQAPLLKNLPGATVLARLHKYAHWLDAHAAPHKMYLAWLSDGHGSVSSPLHTHF